MTPADIRAYYTALGIQLPAWSTVEAPIRCFANPDAHRHRDRDPSCSVNLQHGAWHCHGCGAHGGAYDAALARGHSPRSAMELLIAHRLADPCEAYPCAVRTAITRRIETAARAESIATPLTADDGDVRYWADGLEDDGRLLWRLAIERAWSARTIRDLEIASAAHASRSRSGTHMASSAACSVTTRSAAAIRRCSRSRERAWA